MAGPARPAMGGPGARTARASYCAWPPAARSARPGPACPLPGRPVCSARRPNTQEVAFMSTTLRAAPALVGAVVLILAGCGDDASSPPDDGVVRGSVARIHSGTAVVGATVAVGDEVTTTDAAGEFQLPHVAQGPGELLVQASGYRDHRQSVTVGEWQSFDVVMTPLDTLASLTGRVRHAIDGPVAAQLELGERAITTDAEGRWSADDVPIGPTMLVCDTPPYNRLDTQVIVDRDGQEIDVVLTRDVSAFYEIEHDTYVFTDDDSLNANRGQRVVLWASPELGRVIFIGRPPLGPQWEGVPISRAVLHAHGHLRPQGDWNLETAVPVRLHRLAATFSENAVDFFQRPSFGTVGHDTITVEPSPVSQTITLDVTRVFEDPDAGGLVLSVTGGTAGLGILSSEYGQDGSVEAGWRPRLEMVYRF
ncbi:hypothetical protein GF314_13665 [bacterium]|nr:hypothetical protein [bacterium]